MCLSTNIARRAGSAAYYARIAVPLDVRPLLPPAASGKPKAELWESLRTKDAREAKARAPAVLARWHAEFAELRRRRDARPATEADLEAATWAHYQGELEHHHAERRRLPSAGEIEAAQRQLVADVEGGTVPWTADPLTQLNATVELVVMKEAAGLASRFRAGRRQELQKHLGCGETALAVDAAQALIKREGWTIEPGSPVFRDLCQRLLRAELEALRRAEEQDRGDFTGRPADPVVRPPVGQSAAPVAAPGEGIVELLDAYCADNRARLTPDTLRVNRQIVTMFAEFAGATLPVGAIDKKRHVFPWKAALRRYPTRAAEVAAFKGMSFRKVIVENERLGRPTLSDKTVNRYLSALGGFCTWAHRNGHMDSNPVTGMLIEKGASPSKVRPYTSAQLTAIFASPLFTGAESDDAPHRPGTLRIRDHRYWLPILSLFTGARMGELAQLLTADVRQEQGRWIIHVTREGDDAKTTKTKGSQRVIPVHPELERLGFVAFHARQLAAGAERLFPEIEPDARGQLAGRYSRFYGRYVARIGVKDDASVNFHSFRHGMADALRRAGFRDEEFAPLLGHTAATTTGRYGILSEGDLATRCRMIDAVEFPGLNLVGLTDR